MISNFSEDIICADLRRLINQVWKLLPMKENEENWEHQLTSVLIELHGLHRIFGGQLDFLILISKLEGLNEARDFLSYRQTVFSAISLLTELTNSLNGKS